MNRHDCQWFPSVHAYYDEVLRQREQAKPWYLKKDVYGTPYGGWVIGYGLLGLIGLIVWLT